VCPEVYVSIVEVIWIGNLDWNMPEVVVTEEVVELGIFPQELHGIVDPLIWLHLRNELLVCSFDEQEISLSNV
jgi:hypothetical protein